MQPLDAPSLTRRGFVTSCVGAAAIGAAADCVSAADQPRRRIGFVDDNLDNFHANVYLQALRKEWKDRGHFVAGGFGLQTDNSKTWAAKNGVPYFASVEALNQAVDCFAVLAPSTPKTHWELCQKVLPFGKSTFVDKTFAPDAATGKKIFELADKHKVAVQSTSALRYTNVQRHVAKIGRDTVRHMVAWGAGGSFDEYVIHPLELVVSCMGHEIEALMRRGDEPQSQLLLNFSRGRTAVVNVYTKANTPFAATVTTDKGTNYIGVDTSKLFVDAAGAMLDFFAVGKPQIDRRETMAILRIIDAAGDSTAKAKFVRV